MEQEIFKPISGYDGIYEVSNFGRIKSLSRKFSNNETFLVLHTGKKSGYVSVKLSKNGIATTTSVHILVATYFVDNPFNLLEVNHLDFDRSNNMADNLQWLTHAANLKYSYDNGNRIGDRGEKSPRATLKNETVLKIRELYLTGEYTQKQLADKFGQKRNNIAKIISRKRWSHI